MEGWEVKIVQKLKMYFFKDIVVKIRMFNCTLKSGIVKARSFYI